MMIRVLLAVGLMTLLLVGTVMGGAGYTEITGIQLKVLMDRKEQGLTVIDTRTPYEYQEAHIRGAISIPLDMLEKDHSLLPPAKSARIIFYCNGYS